MEEILRIRIPGVDFRFPITRSQISNDKFIIETWARIKSPDGKYYLQYFMETGDASTGQRDVMWRLMFNVYIAITLGKVDTNLINKHGEPIFELDSDQTDEAERLIKKYNLKER